MLIDDLTSLAATLRLDLLVELLIAVTIGGLIGLERELRGKPAGLRTNILICLGATLVTDVSLGLASAADGQPADAARLAAQVVSGVGFLGAGTIIQSRGTITGLTSAATLWVVAAIGIAIGARHTVEAVGASLLVLIILLPLGALERRLAELRQMRMVTVEVLRGSSALAAFTHELEQAGLAVRDQHLELAGERLVARFEVVGSAGCWTVAQARWLEHPELLALRFG
jgi:putative Mg2+ transporter-C (MgtC) family protein